MKIAVSQYVLQPVMDSPRVPRRGALLQVTFKDGSVGYCDCHPWTEFGDVPLDVQLQLLACSHLTPLLKRSFAAARIDADARKAKRNLFHQLEIPLSHFLLPDITLMKESNIEKLLQNRNQTIKIKVGRDLRDESVFFKMLENEIIAKKITPQELRLRLDFNSRLSEDAFYKWIESFESLKAFVDYYEDPFPFHQKKWQKAREKLGINLACDFDSLQALSSPHSCDVLVVKPAIQEIIPFICDPRETRKLVITSYADHPIGQLSAAYVAAHAMHERGSRLSLCGLLTHNAYEPTPFSKKLGVSEGRLIAPLEGFGLGFDDLLKDLEWKPLC